MLKIGLILLFQSLLSNLDCQVIDGKYENQQKIKDFDTELTLENGDFYFKISFYNTLALLPEFGKVQEIRENPKVNYFGNGKFIVKDSSLILTFSKYLLKKKIATIEFFPEQKKSDSINIDFYIVDLKGETAFAFIQTDDNKNIFTDINGHVNLKLDRKDTIGIVKIIGQPNWQNFKINLKDYINISSYMKIKVTLPENPNSEYIEKGNIKFRIKHDKTISIIDSDIKFNVNDIDYTKWINLVKK
jgi:hypothetical protein